ncbi:MAG: IPT/TIG domain-containing protein [Patescibacteria group bacterium]
MNKLDGKRMQKLYVFLGAGFTLIALAAFVLLVNFRSLADTAINQQAGAGNTAPSVDTVIPSNLSGSGDISLPDAGFMPNEGNPSDLYVRGIVSDPNGCANLDHVVVTVYRSSATDGVNCVPDDNDCYSTTLAANQLAECSIGGSDTDIIFETSFPISNFADPTDSGSQYEDDTWIASVDAYDAGGTTGSLSADFEMQSLAAFGLSIDSINYGALALGATSPQQTVEFSNTGNRLVDAYVNADLDMHSNLAGFADIPSTAVHYSLSDGFAYNTGDTAVELTQTLMDLNLAQQTDDATTTTAAGYFLLKVPTSGVNGTYSNILTFTAYATPFIQGAPTIGSLSATSTLVGSDTTDITITGTNFPQNVQTYLGDTPLTTVRNSISSLTVTILSSLIQSAGDISLTVFNPSTNSTSTPITFSVLNYPPRLTSITPTARPQASGQFTLTLTGDDFVSTSQVKVDGTDVDTAFVSRTELTATVPAAYVETLGDHSVTVTNPAPGGGTSGAQTLTVNSSAPILSSISPDTKNFGDAQFTMTLTGSGFVQASQAKFDGSNRATTYVSPTELTVTIPATDMLGAGTSNITVTNPNPGGGTSEAQTFTVINPAPTLSSISPTTRAIGQSSFTLTVYGNGFVLGSQVKIDGNIVETSFFGGSEVRAIIPSSYETELGEHLITVTTPAPGGGTSAALTFAVENPVPVLGSLSPSSKNLNDAQFTMTLTGSSFLPTSQAQFGGSDRATTYVSPTQLDVTILASDMTTGGTFNITVVNPIPGGGTSAARTFTVNNPAPTLGSISPTSKPLNSAEFNLTLTGTNFVPTSQAKLGGANRATTYVSPTQITATILASDMTSAGTASITVANPTPGGGTSAGKNFSVDNPVPTLGSISPDTKYYGDATFVMTLTGTNFVPTSRAYYNHSTGLTTTYVSPTQLTALVPSTLLTYTGTFDISVNNPSPGGGGSGYLPFNQNNPFPTITNVSPATKSLGDAQFTMTITGTNFTPTSLGYIGGTVRDTTFVSASQINVTIPASDMTSVGSVNVNVLNPAPGGGASDSWSFTVNYPVPTLASISPNLKSVNDAEFTMTLTGTNFYPTSQVKIGGAARVTTYVSPTSLTAVILASDMTVRGTANITVFTPAPGGGTSAAQVFTIQNPVPNLDSISPSTKNFGDAQFTMTLTGTNFVPTSQVKFAGSNRATTYVSPTSLTATILATDMTTSTGNYAITVVNPTPGGGTSGSQTFSLANPTPTLSSISPATKTLGDAQFTMTLTGTGFVPNSQAQFYMSNRATTYVSPTTLTVTIPASDMTSVGTASITVSNPAPGGGTSGIQVFTVANPVPTLTNISPSLKGLNNPEFTMTLTGTNFMPTSQVRLGGSDRTTTYVSPTQLTAIIPASDMTTGAAYSMTVFNPTPGGGTSGSQTFTVESDSNIKLLLHMDGTDNSTTFIDSSPFARTVTASNGAKVSATYAEFNQSCNLSGSPSDKLQAADSDDFYFDGDFTIDLWMMPAGSPNSASGLVTQYAGSTSYSLFRLYGNNLYFDSYQGHVSAPYTFSNDVWYHVAMERYGNQWNFYVNGSRIGQTVSAFSPANVPAPLNIGYYYNGITNYDFRGYIDEVRVVKGVAKYQGNTFTPPTAPY